jgi:hypothetical protein
VYKKGDKLYCKNYRGICLLNVTYKVFAKILYDRLLLHANAAVQHYQAGFQSGNSTTDQLFALRQILEKGYEFIITTHHLFIDFKPAYDTIIRNKVYVGMSELNFLTKATLTIVMCCIKIQKDRETYYLRCFSMACWKLSYGEQTYKGRFVTWGKAWQLATNTLKSSKNLCT